MNDFDATAEVLTPGLAALLLEHLPATHVFIRPCYCPECGRHYSDLVLPSERVSTGVKHRVHASCGGRRV